MKEKIKQIKQIVEKELSCSAHNMEHVMRVYNLSLLLARNQKIDIEVLQIAALLHDIARIKEDKDNSGKINHAILGAKKAEKILKNLNYSKDKIEKIKHCILSHRFRSEHKPETKEAMILFDADKLDVLGAVGVARCYMFAGQQKQSIFSNFSIKKYIKNNLVGGKIDGRIKNSSKHTSNIEFEIKLKNISKKLYTLKAKKLAEKRIEYMKEFFKRLEEEIKGKN